MKELERLRKTILAYEKDPNHTITQSHIKLRMECVVKFGQQAVRDIVSSVCQELLEKRQCLYVERAKTQSSDGVAKKKKSSSALAKPVPNKKTSTTSRLGHRGRFARR